MHPPTWREDAFTVNFVLLGDEPSGAELLAIYQWAREEGLENPRAISPQTFIWSSIFQPRFFTAVVREDADAGGKRIRFTSGGPDGAPPGAEDSTLFWLQSVTFLAAVTLSAAIVQGRWSDGTIASKLDRLWQAGACAATNPALGLETLGLAERVRLLAANADAPAIERLLAIRRAFEEVVEALTAGVTAQSVTVGRPEDSRLARFGFVDDLLEAVPDVQAIIVYGSSVSGDSFADYDAILVVDDSEAAHRLLENASPSWRGKELNLGIYAPEQLWRMQLLSGDNLADYGLCVYGEAELPEKPVDLLLARNLSFGMVRQRQQLGMIDTALQRSAKEGDDRRNLYHYFVKIPANVAKGTFGATGRLRSKEDIQQWLIDRCGFDTVRQQALALGRHPERSLACSAVATGETLRHLNEELRIVELT